MATPASPHRPLRKADSAIVNFLEHPGENFPPNRTEWKNERAVRLPPDIIANAGKNPLCASLLPTAIGIFPRAKGHLWRRTEGIPDFIYIWCLAGEGWWERTGRTQAIGAGELLIIPANEPHAYGSAPLDPWTIAWWHVVGENAQNFFSAFGLKRGGVVRIGLDPYALELFEHILGILEHGYSTLRLVQASTASAYLIGTLLGCLRKGQQSAGAPRYMARVTQSIAFARENLARPLTVADLAAAANLSVAYFYTVFQRQTGFAPLDFFIRLRLHRACQLLETTDQPVAQIAAEVGYADPLYFSRAFRGVHEISPREYRKRHRSGKG